MLYIIQQKNETWYIGAQILIKMSSAQVSIKPMHIAQKMTRKERRSQKEVKTLQEQNTHILPATTFKRIVTQEASRHSETRLRFNANAVKALQTAAEQELTTIFTGSSIIANIAKRDTITIEDMRNFQQLRNFV